MRDLVAPSARERPRPLGKLNRESFFAGVHVIDPVGGNEMVRAFRQRIILGQLDPIRTFDVIDHAYMNAVRTAM